ncbi:MAG: glycosyltransferase family 1 protein [Rhodocyclaceae bacterium]|nr:glycosyltransferase family 1 protein [Rhodocyclaceae bacterium]MBK6908351.1 glycosyltransferase family 1 protein [Rhodocyclaceae bacterium]
MDTGLRIAVVTETYPPEVNGVARTIAKMVDGALQRGDSVDLIRPRQASDKNARLGVRIEAPRGAPAEMLVRGFSIPRYPGMQFGMPAVGLMKAHWRRRRPDVVQVVTEGPLGWAAVRAADALGIPVVSEYHTNFQSYSGHYGLGLLSRIISSYMRRLHNRSVCTLVPTPTLAQDLRQQGYRNVQVVSRGVDMNTFAASRRSDALRRQWGIKPGGLAVAYVGRIAAEKNIALAVRAFNEIRLACPDARLIFVGDGPLRGQVESAVPDAIFAGMRHGDDLAAHYASADMFVFPSLTETFGNVVSESLACGLPVVAYRYAAAAELVCSGVNGWLAEPGNEDDFLSAACRLAAAVGEGAQQSDFQHAATTAAAPLSWSNIHQSMGEILRQASGQVPMIAPPVEATRLPLRAPAQT